MSICRAVIPGESSRQPHTGVRPANSVASFFVKCVGMPLAQAFETEPSSYGHFPDQPAK